MWTSGFEKSLVHLTSGSESLAKPLHFQVAICFAFKSWLNDMLNLDLMKKPIFPGRERRFFHINSSKRTKFLRISVRIFHAKLYFIADSVMEVEVFVSHVTLYLYSGPITAVRLQTGLYQVSHFTIRRYQNKDSHSLSITCFRRLFGLFPN